MPCKQLFQLGSSCPRVPPLNCTHSTFSLTVSKSCFSPSVQPLSYLTLVRRYFAVGTNKSTRNEIATNTSMAAETEHWKKRKVTSLSNPTDIQGKTGFEKKLASSRHFKSGATEIGDLQAGLLEDSDYANKSLPRMSHRHRSNSAAKLGLGKLYRKAESVLVDCSSHF